MKKILTVLAAAIAATLMCVCLAACGNGEPSTAAGTYKYYGTIVNGETHYVTDGDMEATEDYIVITLNADGSGEQKMTFSTGNTVTANFVWTLDGTKLTLTTDGRDAECKLENDIIYFEIGDNVNTLLLKKTV